MPRIVSLVPSVTETLLGWGVEPVAVTRFCELDGYPTVGGTKNPDVDAIVALRPDVVLMDAEENRIADAEALQAAGVRVVATRVRSLADVAPALERIAAEVGAAPPLPGSSAPAAGPRLRVWVPIWRRPWMTVSGLTYGSDLLAAAGFDNVFADRDDPYPAADIAEARAESPDLVLAPSEPYPFAERHRAELESVARAVLVDGRDVFWWGVRTPGALDRLAKLAAGLRQG